MGDVTFLHDANGLVLGPDEPRPDLTIVVVNDDGGSIFALARAGRRRARRRRSSGSSAPRTASTSAGLCAATRTPHWRVDRPAPSSSTRWPARTAASRWSRPSYAATTGATLDARDPGAASADSAVARPPGRMTAVRHRACGLRRCWSVVVVAGHARWPGRLDLPAPLLLIAVGVVGVVPARSCRRCTSSPRWCCSGCCRRCCTPRRCRPRSSTSTPTGARSCCCRSGWSRSRRSGSRVVVHALLPDVGWPAGLRDRRGRRAAGRRRGDRDRPPDRAAAPDRHDPRGRVAAQRRDRAGRAAHRDRGRRRRRVDRGEVGLGLPASPPAAGSLVGLLVFLVVALRPQARHRPGARHRRSRS